MKLKPNMSGKKVGINMIVIRITKTNVLQTSKPCAQCIRKMRIMPERKGYKIENIYYSNGAETMVKTRLNNLECDEKHYSRCMRERERNKKG